MDEVHTSETFDPPPYPCDSRAPRAPQEARTTSSTGSVSTGGVDVGVLDLLDEGAAGGKPDADHVLPNGGEGRGEELREPDVVEADDREVVRHRKARRPHRLDRPDGHHVCRRENCGRRLCQPKQRLHRPLAALRVEVALDLVTARDLQPELAHLRPEAERSVRSRLRVARAGDGGDPRVPERVQMAHGQPRPADVVRGDEAGVVVDHVQVDGHHGDVRPDELLHLGVVAVDAHHDEPVDAMLPCTAEVRVRLAPTRARLLGGEEKEVVPELADPVLEADQHFLEEGMVDVGVLVAREQHDADQLRLLLDQRPGGCAGRVVQPAGDVEHALAGRLAHVVVAVEDPGDGRDRHPALLRDFPDVADLPAPS